jgi:hypothetical protein
LPVIALRLDLILKAANVKVYLPNVLIRHFACFRVYQHKTLQQVIVENEVNVVMAALYRNPFLPSHERTTFAKFKHKILNFVYEHLP